MPTARSVPGSKQRCSRRTTRVGAGDIERQLAPGSHVDRDGDWRFADIESGRADAVEVASPGTERTATEFGQAEAAEANAGLDKRG